MQSRTAAPVSITGHESAEGKILRSLVIGLMAFLTVVDLFAAQALLPSLAAHFGATPAAMGLAVNACTAGMAIGGLGVALYGARARRRSGIATSLVILAVPTALLAYASDLWTFAALRVIQGICMSTAFGLTLAHLGDAACPKATAGAFAAYITGNVASNLIGRLLATAIVDHSGLAAGFLVFAALNVCGAALALMTIPDDRSVPAQRPASERPMKSWTGHLANSSLSAAFVIGFCILFAFIGTFSYVNFILVRPPIQLSMMQLGVIYFVFLPAIATTPLAGRATARFGLQQSLRGALLAAGLGLPLLLVPVLPAIIAGMVLVSAGTFFAQALATGFVSRSATSDRGAASGLYLASYFAGGLAGAAIVGQLFDAFGWPAAVAGIGVALAVAVCFTSLTHDRSA